MRVLIATLIIHHYGHWKVFDEHLPFSLLSPGLARERCRAVTVNGSESAYQEQLLLEPITIDPM
jgi:hypothetical protein